MAARRKKAPTPALTAGVVDLTAIREGKKVRALEQKQSDREQLACDVMGMWLSILREPSPAVRLMKFGRAMQFALEQGPIA